MYTINVSNADGHLFTTDGNNMTDDRKALKAYNAIKSRFPESEGFKVDVTKWQNLGNTVTAEFDEKGKE